jgi:hypothetical protein
MRPVPPLAKPVMNVFEGLLLAGLVLATPAFAQNATTELNQRCATRLSTTILGKAPTSTLLSATDPKLSIDSMLATPEFIEKFSRFINSEFNRDPGVMPADDASYYLAKYVLTNNKPWKDLFAGQYRVDPGATATADAVVVSDALGLGYFRSRAWMVRYAGNETEGYRIVSAYRIMNNVIGLKLQAAVNTDGINATGRKAPACAGCHYNPNFGLDYAAKVLSKRVGMGSTMTFSAPNEGPQPLFGNQQIADDAQFVNAMVNSLDFKFNACRLAMKFLYGRAEFKCEGPVFDQCVSAFTTTGTMQAALGAVAKNAAYCQ